MTLGIVTSVGGRGEGDVKELFYKALTEVPRGSKVHDCSGAVFKLERARHCREGNQFAWISKVKTMAAGFRGRPNKVFKSLCFSCSKPLTEENVLVECLVVDNIRLSTGVSAFFTMARLKEVSLKLPYKNFVNGQDTSEAIIGLAGYN